MSGTLTRINNNQITDAISGNVYFGINANTKVQPYSITSTLLANNLTYGSDLTITGNLSVSGNVTAIDTTNVTIEDPLLFLASNQTGSPTLDIGYIGQRGTSNNIAFVWDESLSSFVTVFTDSGAADNTNINILSYANLITGSANVTGDLIAGNVSLNGNVTSNLNVSGNIAAGNIITVGFVSSSGTVTGGNLITPGLISATGNITTANLISAVGNIYTAGYFIGTFAGNISGNLNVPGSNTQILYNNSGNAGASTGFTFNQASNVMFVAGNILSNASISASGNVTANNFFGNLSGGLSSDLNVNNYIIKGGNYNGITLAMPVGFGANLASVQEGGVTLAAGIGGNTAGTLVLDQTGNISISGNVSTDGNIITAGKISATGNITANYYFGNGSQLTGISSTAGTALTNGNTTITTSLNGNANVTIAGASNVVVWANTGEYVTGEISASGNIIAGNVTTGGLVSAYGNVTGGNILTAGLVSATGNLTAGNIITTGSVSATGNIQTTGNLSVAGNATIVGNLNVQGNVTFIGSNVITTNDLYIQLANNQTTYANINNAGLSVGPNNAPLTYWQYQNSSNSWSTNVAISATANVIGGNLTTSGLITATGNVTGGNILTVGYISSTGNLTSGNINTANAISATGNIYTAGYFVGSFSGNISGNLTVPGSNTQVIYNNVGNAGASSGFTFNQATNVMTISGNTVSGNVLTVGLVSATGNITSGNVLTAGQISATGNLYSNNIIMSSSGGNISGANVITGNTIIAITVSASGNIYGNNLIVANIESVTGNITGGNLFTGGQISAIGNITANTGSFLIGDGAYISNINAANVSSTKIVNGGSYANIASLNSNIVLAVGTSSNIVATFYDHGVNITNDISVSGNIIPGSAILAPSNNSVNIGNSSAAFATVYTYGISTTNTANARVTINPSLYYTNFAVNGSTANILYVDSNTNTVEIGNSRVTLGATLAINASDSMLLPSGNISQRPSSPVAGMLRWNTSLSYLEIWNGTTWSEVGGTAFTVIQNEQFNGDGITTVFNLSSSQTTDSCIVTVNGIVQIPTTAYSVSGVYPSCILTFTEAPLVGDTIDVREITTTTSVHSISNSSSNAVVAVSDSNSNVNITGSLVVGSGSGYIYGDGTYITNVGGNTVSTRIQSGTSQVNIAAPGGEIYMAVGGSNVFDITSAQTTLFGNLNPNGNNTQSLGNSTNRWSNLWISGNTIYIGGSNITANATTLSFGGSPIVTQNANGNISGGNITATTVSATGNITGGNLSVGNGTITAGNIVNSNSNTVGNIGSSSNYFNTVFAKATSALYADLAELYLADAEYSPGKVVSFGGEFEITGSNIDGDTKVAGIVSTNPSYLMNSGLTGKNIIAVTLQGRVPCSVTGTIRKGDMLVSNGDGSARAESNPSIGTVIGKALANFDGKIGIIEVVVGIR